MLLKTKKQILKQVNDFLEGNTKNYDDISISIRIERKNIITTDVSLEANIFAKLQEE